MVRHVSACRERRPACAPYHDSGPGGLYMVNFKPGTILP